MEEQGSLNMDSEEHKHFESRLSRVEAVVESSTKSLQAQISNVSVTLEKIANQQTAAAKTNWNVLGTFAGLILAIVASLGIGFVVNPLQEVKNMLHAQSEVITQHLSDGHPKSVISLLQSNMLAIQSTRQSLKEEMRLTNEAQDKRCEKLHEEFNNIEVWIKDHEAKVGELNAIQTTRIKDLEFHIRNTPVNEGINSIQDTKIDELNRITLESIEHSREMGDTTSTLVERVLALERDMYTGNYRAGRPIRPAPVVPQLTPP